MSHKIHRLSKPPLRLHPGTRTVDRNPNQHALHLRWLSTEQRDQIREAAVRHKMTMVDFVIGIMKRYLPGASFDSSTSR